MSLTAALASAVSGLNVAQRALSVTANNVANANTEGYSRKIVSQQALVVGNRGAGVEATEVTRLTDEFLTQEIRRQSSVAGRSAMLQRYQDLLQDAFGAPGDNNDLALQIGNLQIAIDALADSPETSALALQVVQAAGDLGRSLGGLADQVQVLRGDADQAIGRTVDEINADLREHPRAQRRDRAPGQRRRGQSRAARPARHAGEQPGREDRHPDRRAGRRARSRSTPPHGETLLDRTPRVLAYEPAAQVAQDTPFGQIAIFREDQIDPATGAPIDPTAGVQLVSSGIRATLNAELQNDAVADAGQQITSRITGGRLAGLLEIRDRILPALDDQLQELADGLRFALNAAHNDGSPVPPPSAAHRHRTDLSDFAGATRSGTATIAVIDRTDGSTLLAFQVDVGAAADENALAAQIDSDLGAFGSAAIGADGNLEITLANSDQGLAVAEGDSSDHPRRCGRPRPRLRLRPLFRPQRPPGPGRRAAERLRGPRRHPGRSVAAQHGAARRHDLAAGRDARRRRRQPRRPGAGRCAEQRPAGDRARRPAGQVGQPRDLRRRHHRPQREPRRQTPSRRRAAIGRSPTSSTTAPPRSPGSISTRRWPAWCSCSRPTRPPPGSSR